MGVATYLYRHCGIVPVGTVAEANALLTAVGWQRADEQSFTTPFGPSTAGPVTHMGFSTADTSDRVYILLQPVKRQTDWAAYGLTYERAVEVMSQFISTWAMGQHTVSPRAQIEALALENGLYLVTEDFS